MYTIAVGYVIRNTADVTMEWRQPRPGRNRNVFKGSFLVSTLLDQHSNRFKSRAVAVKFAKKLFREGQIKSIFGANSFEDSAHLYMWNDDVINDLQRTNMTSNKTVNHVSTGIKESRYDQKVIDDAKNKILNRGEQINLVKPFNNFIQEVQRDYLRGSEQDSIKNPPSVNPKNYSSLPTYPVVEPRISPSQREKLTSKYIIGNAMSNSRNRVVLSGEKLMDSNDRKELAPMEFNMAGNVTGTMNSQTSSVVTAESSENNRRWGETIYSYSDNEKQLIEEMKRMKKEHQHILKTYEERINKLMAKMHELRSIAEMLENSSTKSSPYGVLPNKANLLSIIGSKLEEERKQAALLNGEDAPPPLPPRPSRGNKVYPNKPIIHTGVPMKTLQWTRIIVADETEHGPASVWHGIMEPKIDGEELEKLFCAAKESLDDISLFDDIYVRRGRPKQQLVNIFDNEKAQRIIVEMRNIRCTLNDLIQSVSQLDTKEFSQESLAQLLDLICSSRDMDKILHHIKRKGAGQLDYPEYLISELAKIDHFRERLDFLRFKEKLQINLFEIEQQLRELHTACDEISSSLSLKNLLATLLTVGNYLNGGSDKGQADGFHLDILNKLKDVSDKTRRGNLHEFIVKSYCKIYESDVESGCPTKFRLPEPSNMRHAAQVSFDDIQRALSSLRQELHGVRDKIEALARKENSNITYQLRVTSENYLTCAVEVLSEEDRLLEETKKYFRRTTTFFIHDNRQCTPQEFFQIWASFLHDTKFYWKLAHRNLAKAKFEMEFLSKNQMSSTSQHSHGKYRNEVKKRLTNLGEDHDRHISRAQQLKHINNWIESVGKYAEEIKTEMPVHSSSRTTGKKDKHHSSRGHEHRPSSPKPLTSTPPDVHKPLALNHNSPTQAVAPYTGNGHNYMNQESPYDTIVRGHNTDNDDLKNLANTAPQDSSAQKKSSTQFSLKSWLKREQSKRTDDGTNTQAQKSQTPVSTGTLGKIRNTVVNKFSNSKRPNDTQQEPIKNEIERQQKGTDTSNSPPQHQTILTGNEINVNMVTGPNIYVDRAKGDYQGLYFEVPISRDSGYHGQNSNPSTLSSTKSRDSSPPKYDYSKDRQFAVPKPVNNKNTSPPNDMNNNRKHRVIPPETPPKPLRSKDRALLAQNSGHNILDSYGRTKPIDIQMDKPQHPTTIHKAESVPVYKAKLIPNYENQGKMDPRMQGIRGQAEPVVAAHKPQISNSSDAYRNELARKSEMYIKSGQPSSVNPLKQSSLSPESYGLANGHGSNSDFGRCPQQHFGEYPARRSASTQNILERSSNQFLSPPQPSSDPRLLSSNRPSANSASVTNLIDRFEKSPIQIDGDKPPSMTSTPLTHRRNQPTTSPERDSYNTSPHKARSQDRNNPRSRESSQPRHRDSSQPRHQDYNPARQLDYHDADQKPQVHPVPKPRRTNPQSLSPGNQFNYNQTSPHQQQSNHHDQHHHGHQPHQSANQYHQQSSKHHHQQPVQQKNNHPQSEQYGVFKATPVSYHIPRPENNYGLSDPEDNYSDQLRKASKAKNSATFDRYQTTSPHYSRHQTGAMAVVKPTIVQPTAMDI
ncbi:uncharacterized protein LOC126815870 isoform X2 [Patella vulgata]|uniref:uncharacterized protein LOC126815870 isoform X2 n=1 Tax=Patella vulgata TaxID=6465 RepID=UPI0024A7CC5A|nr:uncharacterized protein LOC126815870 isoform X2 [Patella vulgata]